MVVFGGYDGSYRHDTWAMTLSGEPTWSELTTSGTPPAGRNGHSAIYDPLRDRMVVFGGGNNSGRRNDLWELSLREGLAWSELTPSGTVPPERYGQASIYDPIGDRMVMFGGMEGTNEFTSDLWVLNWDHIVDDVPAPYRPSRLILHTARPNPTHLTAEIRYEIASEQHATLDVLDIQGRIARRLRQGVQTAGSHSVGFDRRDGRGRLLPAGVYLIRLSTHNEVRTTRVVVIP